MRFSSPEEILRLPKMAQIFLGYCGISGKWVSYLRIAQSDCIIFENEIFSHKMTAVDVEAPPEFHP
jgi:hypothetical protein